MNVKIFVTAVSMAFAISVQAAPCTTPWGDPAHTDVGVWAECDARGAISVLYIDEMQMSEADRLAHRESPWAEAKFWFWGTWPPGTGGVEGNRVNLRNSAGVVDSYVMVNSQQGNGEISVSLLTWYPGIELPLINSECCVILDYFEGWRDIAPSLNINAFQILYRRVPEPSSIALVLLAALGATLVGGHRRLSN